MDELANISLSSKESSIKGDDNDQDDVDDVEGADETDEEDEVTSEQQSNAENADDGDDDGDDDDDDDDDNDDDDETSSALEEEKINDAASKQSDGSTLNNVMLSICISFLFYQLYAIDRNGKKEYNLIVC